MERKYETVFEPVLSEGGEALFFDKESVYLPKVDDFPFLHYHKRYEIGEILSGEGEIICGGKFYSVRSGDMIFVPPSVRHYSRSLDALAPCYARFIYIDEDFVKKIIADFKSEPQPCDIPSVIRADEYASAASLLRGISESCYSQIEGKAESTALRIAAFLFEAAKWFDKSDKDLSITEKRIGEQMRAVAEHISLHYNSPPTSGELARLCHLSESQLRRSFKRAYGCSPIEYRTRVRMAVARELLAHSELSVGAIADKLGYPSPSDFCRAFKKICGNVPSSLRENVKEAQK